MRAVLLLLVLAPFCAAAEDTAEVKITATVPADTASFTGRVLEVRLYRYDPRLADRMADLVEKVEVKGFAHSKGKATVKELALGRKEKLDAKMGYYLTLFVLDGGKRTHMGKCDHVKEPFNKVLTMGNPRKVKAAINEIKTGKRP
jgi:hypothetical protein